jgi:hypothetical protein
LIFGSHPHPDFSGQSEEMTGFGRTTCVISGFLGVLGVTVSSVFSMVAKLFIAVSKVFTTTVFKTREIMLSPGLNVKIKEHLELIFSSYLSDRHNEC